MGRLAFLPLIGVACFIGKARRVDGEIDGVGNCMWGRPQRPKKREAEHVKRADACWARRELAHRAVRCIVPLPVLVLGWAAAGLPRPKVRIALPTRSTHCKTTKLARLWTDEAEPHSATATASLDARTYATLRRAKRVVHCAGRPYTEPASCIIAANIMQML